ncbi:MAG: hypothetical protein O9272_11935 [Brevundimonas sp.]|jgi:hypothetical protein|nr:hypothetical protein [Brevundimonas sp.]
MKGHVGDGARSGELQAPGTGFLMPMSDMSFVSITFDKCRYRLLKFDAAVGGFTRAAFIVTQT